jgi:hypothetical protein
MAHVIRSIGRQLLLAVVLALLPAAQARAQCLGDCNGDGSVGPSELTNIIALINCCPCADSLLGGADSGCAATGGCANLGFPGGTIPQCTAADRNDNQCITAGELTGVINDILDFPNGCPPVTPTSTPVTPVLPTNTPVTPATATNTPVTPATPTNTPVTPATATNTPVTPVLPTNTPVTPPTATNTIPAPTATNTIPAPTATNTPAAASPTPTPSPTQGGVARLCGNGVTDAAAGEECDNGGTCIGGDNAGTHCTADSDCIGQGVCDAGLNLDYVCDSDADCPSGHCIHCRTFGGSGCAANCTFETTVNAQLIPSGATAKPGTSFAWIHTNQLIPAVLTLPLNGSQTFVFGKQRDGSIPGVIKADSVSFAAINVVNTACACVRGEPAMTCGGYIFEKDGSAAIDCTPGWVEGTCSVTTSQTCVVNGDCPSGQTCVVHACDGLKPCALVHGPGNSASGVISCAAELDASDSERRQNPRAAHPGNAGTCLLTGRLASGQRLRLRCRCRLRHRSDLQRGHRQV